MSYLENLNKIIDFPLKYSSFRQDSKNKTSGRYFGTVEFFGQKSLSWGITPQIMKFPGSTDEMISETEKALLKKDIVKKGDSIVIIATSPFTLGGKTNIMKIHKVGF